MTPATLPTDPQAEYVRLSDNLREHKRQAAYHKRAGRRTKMSLLQLQEMCDLAGVRLRVETDPHEALGGHGGEPREGHEQADAG
jgi:hypothetical protein